MTSRDLQLVRLASIVEQLAEACQVFQNLLPEARVLLAEIQSPAELGLQVGLNDNGNDSETTDGGPSDDEIDFSKTTPRDKGQIANVNNEDETQVTFAFFFPFNFNSCSDAMRLYSLTVSIMTEKIRHILSGSRRRRGLLRTHQ